MPLPMTAITFSSQAQTAGDGVHGLTVPRDMTLVGVDSYVEAFTGSPTNINFDIQDDGTDIVTAVTTHTAAGAQTWKTPHTGGTNTPVHIAAGSLIEVDVNFTGGTSPSADYTITLWMLEGK